VLFKCKRRVRRVPPPPCPPPHGRQSPGTLAELSQVFGRSRRSRSSRAGAGGREDVDVCRVSTRNNAPRQLKFLQSYLRGARARPARAVRMLWRAREAVPSFVGEGENRKTFTCTHPTTSWEVVGGPRPQAPGPSPVINLNRDCGFNHAVSAVDLRGR
jgi:hypothetical protein